jgi:hypothetical protein
MIGIRTFVEVDREQYHGTIRTLEHSLGLGAGSIEDIFELP